MYPIELDEDYDEYEYLIDNDPIALGQRCREAEDTVRELRNLVKRLIRKGVNYTELGCGWLQVGSNNFPITPEQEAIIREIISEDKG